VVKVNFPLWHKSISAVVKFKFRGVKINFRGVKNQFLR